MSSKVGRGGGVALVTGATSGHGRGVARALSAQGWTVLVHGRDAAKADQVVAEVERAGGSGRAFVADLSSLAETARLGREVLADHPRLDLLLNNAGLGFGADSSHREVSPDGYELRFAVMYLQAVELTEILHPALAAASGQVLNVGSLGQAAIDFDDLQFTRGYEGSAAYMRAKFALAAFSWWAAREYADEAIAVNCIHPATFMDTAMTRDSGIRPSSDVDSGVRATMKAIQAGQDGASGEFFNGSSSGRAMGSTYDEALQDRLMTATGQLITARAG